MGTSQEFKDKVCKEQAMEEVQQEEYFNEIKTEEEAQKVQRTDEKLCQEYFKTEFGWDAALWLITDTALSLYFFLVLLQHWRNSNKSRSEGGLEDATQEQEMQPRTVENAADDTNLQTEP